MSGDQTVSAVIITLDADLKPTLIGELEKHSRFSEVAICIGQIPADFGCLSQGFHLPSSCHTNSGISCVEHAISHSHFLARCLGATLNTDWVLILEEDCILLDGFSELEELLTRVNGHGGADNPLAIHLFPEQYGLLKIDTASAICVVKRLPDCAMAYVLNRNAMRLTLSDDVFHNYVADWPPLLRGLHWYSPMKSLTRHPDLNQKGNSSSTTESRNLRLKAMEVHLKQFILNRVKIAPFLLLSVFLRPYGHHPIQARKLRSLIYGR